MQELLELLIYRGLLGLSPPATPKRQDTWQKDSEKSPTRGALGFLGLLGRRTNTSYDSVIKFVTVLKFIKMLPIMGGHNDC